MRVFADKFKENLLAVAPILVIVLALNFTVAPLGAQPIMKFLIGSVLIVIGLTFFLIGVDNGITPLGSRTGSALAKSNKIKIVVLAGIVLGFFTSIAEPGLMVLASQIDAVTMGKIPAASLLFIVSAGLAILLAVGFVRILYDFALYKLLILLYIIIGIMAVFTSPEFLGIAFDASGATTGILAVPFILSLGVGISALKKNSVASEEDSFGLVAIASTGAIIAVFVLNMLTKTGEFSAELEVAQSSQGSVLSAFTDIFPATAKDGFITLLPLLVILIVLQKISFKMSAKSFKKILIGFVYAYIGLVIFFLGVDGGFMDVGVALGYSLASRDGNSLVVIVGFLIGFVTIMAEPAVYVLTRQIEDITSGHIKRKLVLFPLCIGVGIAVALSVVRILSPGIHLWHYLLPGYIIAVALMFFVPKLFVGIAFDAGGVATGPMTATFILAFTQGAAESVESANVLTDGFGMISMVALMPIITLQMLGFVFGLSAKKEGVV